MFDSLVFWGTGGFFVRYPLHPSDNNGERKLCKTVLCAQDELCEVMLDSGSVLPA